MMKSPLKLRERKDRDRLSDVVYETLLEVILARRLLPGTILSELARAKQLDVSRTPVHDAVRQLTKDGLVEHRPGHRAVVAAFTREDVADIYEMRKLLEGEAARRAANRIDRATLGRLRGMGEELKGDPERPDWLTGWADFDEAFHEAIARASGSRRLWQDICRYRMLHRGFNRLSTTVEALQQALQEHVRILQALEKRDPEEARQAMVEHLVQGQMRSCLSAAAGE